MSTTRITRNPAPVIPGIADSVRLSSGDTVFISGQIGFEADGSRPATFERAVELTYAQLERAMSTWGATYDDLVRVNAYITHLDQEKLAIWRKTRDRVMNGSAASASTVIGVAGLFNDAEFEIDAILSV